MSGMRILIVSQSYHPHHGGIGEHVRHLGLALKERGHAVRILTAGPPPIGGELPGLPIIRLGRRFTVSSNGSKASVAWSPLYRASVRRALAIGFDLIHVHSPLEPFLPWAVLREAGLPCVGTFHNAGRPHVGLRLLSPFLAPMAMKLHPRIAVSRTAALYAGRHFPGEYLLIPNGVDLARFRPSENGRDPGPLSILFVGRLEPRKGLDVLIDGVAIAGRRAGRPLRLIVVGDGSLRGRVLRRAARAGVDLRLLGEVDPAAIPSIYRDADLFVAPALHGESFGIVLLEALASGLPVIASRIDGFSEVLDGCPAAALFSPGDPRALASAIKDAIGRAQEGALRDAARAHARGFSWGKVSLLVEGAYREALGRGAAMGERIVVADHGREPRARSEEDGPRRLPSPR